jgi:hypothetical protein
MKLYVPCAPAIDRGREIMLRFAATLLALLVSCVVVSAETFIGPDGKPVNQAKCRVSPRGCYDEAHDTCSGPYQIIDSESHAGGILADILPGPVTWYSFTYACGRSDGRLASFPLRGAAPRMPNIQVQAPAVVATPPAMTRCSSSRVGGTVWTNCY